MGVTIPVQTAPYTFSPLLSKRTNSTAYNGNAAKDVYQEGCFVLKCYDYLLATSIDNCLLIRRSIALPYGKWDVEKWKALFWYDPTQEKRSHDQERASLGRSRRKKRKRKRKRAHGMLQPTMQCELAACRERQSLPTYIRASTRLPIGIGMHNSLKLLQMSIALPNTFLDMIDPPFARWDNSSSPALSESSYNYSSLSDRHANSTTELLKVRIHQDQYPTLNSGNIWATAPWHTSS